MLAALNAWTLTDATAPAEQLAAVASAGLDGIELVVSDDGRLSPETPADDRAALVSQAADLGIRIVSLATAAFWQFNYGSPDQADRRRAHDLTLRMLDLAADLDAGAILVVPAVVGTWNDARMAVTYADALRRTHDALNALCHEAETRDAVIAIENVWNRLLLSPVEAADLIDRVNSPNVGFYFDTGNVVPFGYPQDWIATLGGRIVRVHIKDYDLTRPGLEGFCPLGEGDVDWPAVVAALRAAGYDGPLTFEGPGDPAVICRRLRNILGDRPVLAEEGSA